MTLSDRDAQIVDLYNAGFKVPQIASRVGRRPFYVQKVLAKLRPDQSKRRKS